MDPIKPTMANAERWLRVTCSMELDLKAETWRTMLLAILAIGTFGVLVELVLLGHYDDVWQYAPLVLGSLLLLAVAWAAWRPSPRAIRTVRWLSVVACISAAVGVYFHLMANIEWELETTPEMQGLELFREVVTGALPLLAPGAMFQLGLIGLLWAWQHPRLPSSNSGGVPSHENTT